MAQASHSDRQFDLFVSYAHKDNARGQVRELGDAIVSDFHAFAGRELRIFFDEDDIPSMAAWEKRIARGLSDSRLFLAVVSPNYFASPYCRREWEEYVRYEAMRQCLGEGVAPVYFIELPGLGGPGVEQSISHWVDELRKRQWCDIRPWHDAGRRALEDAHIAERLKQLRSEIKERLSRAGRAKQSPTNIYRHNPQFVGRIRELTILREALNERGSLGVVGHKTQASAIGPGATAVHGLGGMGKTELALAYAHAFAWDYPGGRWLAPCEGIKNFDLALIRLADPRALNITFTEAEQKDSRLAGERILAELSRRDRSLLMLDNVTSPGLLGPDVLMRLPPQGHVHLIATTRLGPAQLAGSPHDHTFVAVDELPPDDALALLRGHQPEARFATAEDDAAARELVALLAGFTLAVETAAIYLGRHAAPGALAAYTERLLRELLAESEKAAADPSVGVRHKERLLERTLAVTLEILSAEQLHVLTLAALLPADQVALPWLHALAGDEFPSLKPDAAPAWQQLADSLLSLRLLQPGGDPHIVRMHRFVQELLVRRAGHPADNLRQQITTHAMSRCQFLETAWLDWPNRWEIEPLVALSQQTVSRKDPGASFLAGAISLLLENLARYSEAEPLMRHSLALDEESYGPNHPVVAVRLNNIGWLLFSTNRLQEAEQLYRRAISIQEHLGPQEILARSFSHLALLLQDTGRMEEADQLSRRALEIAESCYGQTDRRVGVYVNNRALCLRAANRLIEAEPLMRRSLMIHELSHSSTDPTVAICVSNLAQLLQDTDRFAEAESLMHRALEIDEMIYGQEHPKVALRLNNLAQLLQATNRAADAEPMMRRALSIDEKFYKRDHPAVIRDMTNLACLLVVGECFEEAETLLRRKLTSCEATCGPQHPDVAIHLNDLAMFLESTDRPIEAESLMRQALAIDEKSYGPESPTVAKNLNKLSQVLKGMNRMEEAELFMRRALAIDEKSHGPEHPIVAADLNNLARLLYDTSRMAEAEPIMRRALAIDEISFGLEHPNVALPLNNLASLFYATNRLVEAEPLMSRVVAISEKSYGESHPDVATALNNLAQLLKAANRLAEAEPLMRRALAIDEKSFAPDHPHVARDLNNLARMLMAANRFAEAEPLARRALAIHEGSYGPNHPTVISDLNNLSALLSAEERFADAEPFLRRVVEALLRSSVTTGQEHHELDDVIGRYTSLLASMGRSLEEVVAQLSALAEPLGYQFAIES